MRTKVQDHSSTARAKKVQQVLTWPTNKFIVSTLMEAALQRIGKKISELHNNKQGKWRMCTYFTNLNKYCPKDDFLLTRINKVVDSITGCEIMALLDCFLGYHLIWLRDEDQEKTSFITPFGTYCYLRMPEGLKNAGPTFYEMSKVILREQMERNVFAYVDDIVVANRKKETQLQDLAETFVNMWKA
jgi:hypothetical protein